MLAPLVPVVILITPPAVTFRPVPIITPPRFSLVAGRIVAVVTALASTQLASLTPLVVNTCPYRPAPNGYLMHLLAVYWSQ
jgi:hypothetical protein